MPSALAVTLAVFPRNLAVTVSPDRRSQKDGSADPAGSPCGVQRPARVSQRSGRGATPAGWQGSRLTSLCDSLGNPWQGVGFRDAMCAVSDRSKTAETGYSKRLAVWSSFARDRASGASMSGTAGLAICRVVFFSWDLPLPQSADEQQENTGGHEACGPFGPPIVPPMDQGVQAGAD